MDKVLRLTKAEAKEWIKQSFRGGLLSLHAYHQFKKLGLGLNFEQSHQLCSLANKEYLVEFVSMFPFAPLEAICRYLLKQLNRKGAKQIYHDATRVLRDWKDYLKECNELGMDLEDESVLFPNDLNSAHQKTSSKVKFKRDEALQLKIANRARELINNYFEKNGLLIRPVLSNPELFQEGKTLNHCVGSYADRYAIGAIDLYVIRRIDEPDKPFYTMEVRNGKVEQCRGFKNCSMNSEVRGVVDAFTISILNKKSKQKPNKRQEVAV